LDGIVAPDVNASVIVVKALFARQATGTDISRRGVPFASSVYGGMAGDVMRAAPPMRPTIANPGGTISPDGAPETMAAAR